MRGRGFADLDSLPVAARNLHRGPRMPTDHKFRQAVVALIAANGDVNQAQAKLRAACVRYARVGRRVRRMLAEQCADVVGTTPTTRP